MKILFYTHAFSGGGAEIVFGRLAGAFAEAGHHVVVAADHGDAPPPHAGRMARHVFGSSHALSTLRLVALLRRERPDASFSALGAQNLKHAAACVLAGRLSRCVLGYHGFAEAEPKRLSRLSYHLTPLLTRLAARTVCVSDALLRDVAERWGGCNLTRIYNPVSAAPAEGDDERDPTLVLAIGRLVPLKRFHDLVEAVDRSTEPALRLVIIGEGPEHARLDALIAERGLSARVHLAGPVDDLAPWYRRAACVAIASESESFGLTAAEALAHGLPVVATACGGPPELLGDLAGCHVVPIGDVTALAAALERTIRAPGDAAARRARARAFAPDTVRDAYAALIVALG